MSSFGGINTSVSGLVAQGTRLDVSSHNVANVTTPGFVPTQAVTVDDPPGGVRVELSPQAQQLVGGGPDAPSGTDLVRETATRMTATSAYKANIAAIRTADEMMRSVLDLGR